MPKTPLEQFEEAARLQIAHAMTEPLTLLATKNSNGLELIEMKDRYMAGLTAAARQLVVSEMEGLKEKAIDEGEVLILKPMHQAEFKQKKVIWLEAINQVIKQYKEKRNE